VDLNEFLRELYQQTTVNEPPKETETPEQAAERQRLRDEATATKRADITRRHTAWEQRVSDLSNAKLQEFAGTLARLRSGEVFELGNAKHAEVMQKDADKALKNTEAFVRRLVTEADGKTTTREEKVVLLENIVGKVKKRFDDGASVVSGNVMTWWDNTRQREADEIERLVSDVRDLGTTAQADLGLDYAWLDDVTVKDWTRYHGLLNVAKDLQTKLMGIASGTDANAPHNVLSEAMRDLQLDLETVVLRFRSDLNTVHQSGLEAIRAGHATPLVPRVTPSVPAEEPVMSILPVYDGDEDVDAAGPEHIVMGKSKEQVQDAMKMAAEAAGVHVEL